MKAIEVQELTVSFNGKPVLQDVSFDIEEGEITVIAGASGSGKTVLLKTIIGLLTPEKGMVRIYGEDISTFNHRRWNTVRQQIGMVFQSNALFDSLSVWENVGFYLLERTRMPAGEIRQKAKETLELVGLKESEDLLPSELSGGMQKRAALARTLLFNPKIILYDEPTAGLDPITAETSGDLILKLKSQLNSTALVASHDQNLTFRVADKIGLIYHGRMVAFDTVPEILKSKENIVRRFFQLDANKKKRGQ